MFHFIKQSLQKIYTTITGKLTVLFSRTAIDADTLKELELILLQADTGIKTTQRIINQLKEEHKSGVLHSGDQLKAALSRQLHAILKQEPHVTQPEVIVLVGINGSGKTTCAAKIAYQAQQANKRCLLVAADTFRAAATQQLETWASITGTAIEIGTPGQDPASVVFTGCSRFKQEKFDLLIIDTAGRLQTKVNLMKELEKIKRIICKQLVGANIATYLTIDAMLGQNSFQQAQLFHESTDLSGVILTKMDGTGKGGVIFAIADQLHIPILYISYAETPEAFKPFDYQAYITELLQQ